MPQRVALFDGPILIPIDGSDFAGQALPYAQSIAGPDAAFVLLQALPKAQPLRGALGNVLIPAEEVERANAKAARSFLEALAAVGFAEHDRVRIEVVAGDPAEQILRAAKRHKASIIAIATHGLAGLDRWMIGSVADRIARSSPVPVLMIRPKHLTPDEPADTALTRIVVPLDGSPLAAEALPVAEALAHGCRLPLCLATVSELPREFASAMAYGAVVSERAFQDVLDEGMAQSNAMIASAAIPLRAAGLTVETCVLQGVVSEAIASITGPHDLIVMTSHGRGGVGRWLLGSVASKLIHQGPAPLLLVPSSVRSKRAAKGGENNA